MSPVPIMARGNPANAAISSSHNHRGTSPVAGTSSAVTSGQPFRVTNSREIQQNFQQQLQTIQSMSSVFPLDGAAAEPPPPYPMGSAAAVVNPPPSYSQSVAMRQSPTLSSTSSDYRALDFRRSPAPPIPNHLLQYQVHPGQVSLASSGLLPNGTSPVPSPASSMMSTSSRSSMQAWSARQAKTHSPVIMQSVKSTQVQKPILQTATPVAPAALEPVIATSPAVFATPQPPTSAAAISRTTKSTVLHGTATAGIVMSGTPTMEMCSAPPPPSYEFSILQKQQQQQQQRPLPMTPSPSPVNLVSNSPLPVQRTLSPATPSLDPGCGMMLPPPPPYPSTAVSSLMTPIDSPASMPTGQDMVCGTVMTGKAMPLIQTAKVVTASGTTNSLVRTIESKPPLARKYSPMTSETGSSTSRSESPVSDSQQSVSKSAATVNTDSGIGHESSTASAAGVVVGKEHHTSPKPERKHLSQAKEEARRESLIRNCPPSAFKFFMEQHVENVIKEYEKRRNRQLSLEQEFIKFNISDPHMQEQMRLMLRRKETNYLRMRRAKLNRKDFKKIKTIGVGAFGEVSLVRSLINGSKSGGLYAMKTLKKSVVVERKQVAHVIAEKDILAESDNEWIVKLYYSFQDKDNLYFVMEYIPGGDLMSMLIKEGRFSEDLARFYIAELTVAVDSVHRVGFIHRDIKPDNILIDANGHIKLTDFGLCTGFRWTHNSEYYHNNRFGNNHHRQDSMDPINMKDLQENGGCSCPHVANGMKPLERRRRRQLQRCMAHSLVGTPNYIAPEVLLKQGYTQSCDWWSVGVILFEMIIGQPPFLADTTVNTQAKVVRWRETLQIPKGVISTEAENLIRGLCNDAEIRLGSQGGAEEIKRHPFFNGIDFSINLRSQRAPWKPEILHETDTSNFDPIDPERLNHSDSENEDSASNKENHGFYEFTFRRFFDGTGHPLPMAEDRSTLPAPAAPPDPVYV